MVEFDLKKITGREPPVETDEDMMNALADALGDADALRTELAASKQVASMMTAAAGKHAETVESLRALNDTLRERAHQFANERDVLRAQLLEHAEVCKEGPWPATALRARVAELEAALRHVGKHPEDCVAGEPGPCTSHMAYLEVEAELAALRAGPSAGPVQEGGK